jgi:hypothetical protein
LFVSLSSRIKKEPLGGGEPRQARAEDKIERDISMAIALRFPPARE